MFTQQCCFILLGPTL